jgi:hypothetical protein
MPIGTTGELPFMVCLEEEGGMKMLVVALQNVDGLFVGEVVMVRPSPAPRRHLLEAAPQLLPAGGRAELLAPVAEVLPM